MEQVDLLRRLISVLNQMQIPYMLVGSYASAAYGEPRMTHDIDILAALQSEQIPALCAAFPAPEYYVSQEAALAAVRARGQFNVIHPASGTKIDFILARADAWGKTEMERREKVWVLPDCEGFVARPEDVIIGKLISYRQGGSEKHLRDITGMLVASGREIDREYVAHWAADFDATDIWQSVLRRVAADRDD